MRYANSVLEMAVNVRHGSNKLAGRKLDMHLVSFVQNKSTRPSCKNTCQKNITNYLYNSYHLVPFVCNISTLTLLRKEECQWWWIFFVYNVLRETWLYILQRDFSQAKTLTDLVESRFWDSGVSGLKINKCFTNCSHTDTQTHCMGGVDKSRIFRRK